MGDIPTFSLLSIHRIWSKMSDATGNIFLVTFKSTCGEPASLLLPGDKTRSVKGHTISLEFMGEKVSPTGTKCIMADQLSHLLIRPVSDTTTESYLVYTLSVTAKRTCL